MLAYENLYEGPLLCTMHLLMPSHRTGMWSITCWNGLLELCMESSTVRIPSPSATVPFRARVDCHRIRHRNLFKKDEQAQEVQQPTARCLLRVLSKFLCLTALRRLHLNRTALALRTPSVPTAARSLHSTLLLLRAQQTTLTLQRFFPTHQHRLRVRLCEHLASFLVYVQQLIENLR